MSILFGLPLAAQPGAGPEPPLVNSKTGLPAAALGSPSKMSLITIDENFGHQVVRELLQVFVDPTGLVQIEQLPAQQWTKPPHSVIQTPNGQAAVWSRFAVRNGTDKPQGLILEHANIRSDNLQLYVFRGGQLVDFVRHGDVDRPAHYSIQFTRPFLEFTLGPHETVQIIVREQSLGLKWLAMALRSQSNFSSYATQHIILQSAFFGPLLVLVVFFTSLILYSYTRILLDYIIYMLMVAVHFFQRSGFIDFLWPSAPQWFFNEAYLLTACFAIGAAMRFQTSFLELKPGGVRRQIIRVAHIVLFIPAVIVFFSYFQAGLIERYTQTIAVLLAWGTAASLLHRSTRSRIFLVVWSLPAFALLMENQLNMSGTPADTDLYLQLGLVLEFSIFSVLVGQRIQEVSRDKIARETRVTLLRRELAQARRIHSALLPPEGSRPERPSISVYYKPESELGGDYYDITELPDGRVGVLLADVTGHGLAAALDASSVRLGFRTNCLHFAQPSAALSALNNLLTPHLNHRFVTAVYAIIEPQTLKITLSCAGHPSPALMRTSGAIEFPGVEGMLLGFRPDMDYTDSTITLRPGEQLCLYTDGLYDSDSNTHRDYFQTLNLLMKSAAQPQPAMAPSAGAADGGPGKHEASDDPSSHGQGDPGDDHLKGASGQFHLRIVEAAEKLREGQQVDDITLLTIEFPA